MRIARSLALVLIVFGCGGGNGPTDNNAVASVLITVTGGATLQVGQTRTLSATVRDAEGGTLAGKTVSWTLNPAQGVATLSATTGASVTLTGSAAGTVTVTATSEGKSDDQVMTVQSAGPAPTQATVQLMATTFNPDAVTLQRDASATPKATVTWVNNSNTVHSVTFDSPPATVPNKDPFNNGDEHVVQFTTAGTYNYHCRFHGGMTGTIVVNP